ncbi:MAG: thiol reductant ABC exporter subunit CydC [Acidobacteriota bacterium]
MSTDAGRLLGLAAPERRGVGLAVLLQVLTVLAGVGLMGTSAWLISKAALHPSIAALQVAIVGVRFFGISRGVFRYLERLVSHDVTLRLLTRLRVRVYRALEPLAPARLVGFRSGDVLGRVLEDVSTLENLYVRLLGPSLSALVIAAVVGAVLLPLGAVLAVMALAGLGVAGLLVPGLAARVGRDPGRRLVETRAELGAELIDGVQGVGEILAFGGEESHAARVAARGRTLVAEQDRLARASALGGSLVGLAADLSVVGVVTLAIPAVRGGDLDGVSLAVVALVTLAAFEGVAALPAAWQGLGATGAAARRLFEIIDRSPAVEEPRSPAEAGGRAERGGTKAPLRNAPLLELRGLCFTYPGAHRPALGGIDIRLGRGQRLAVVGASGSGKSTLAHLILRFWDVPDGSIWLRGRDVRSLPTDAVRGDVAFSAQRTHLFTGTVKDNLLLANPKASGEEIARVVDAAQLGALVSRLPRGLDTWIGEQGLQLSGGERQRLALGRALLRPASILLLDEPTAHLDAVTERSVLEEIVRAGDGRATLLITHRLVGLESFDEVLVLERGRVRERGRARELASRGGPFARMLALQRARGALGDDAFRSSGSVRG